MSVISHDIEEWCKIWRKPELLFQKVCAKYITFDLKKYREMIFYDAEEWCKIWTKTDLWKLGLWLDSFV